MCVVNSATDSLTFSHGSMLEQSDRAETIPKRLDSSFLESGELLKSGHIKGAYAQEMGTRYDQKPAGNDRADGGYHHKIRRLKQNVVGDLVSAACFTELLTKLAAGFHAVSMVLRQNVFKWRLRTARTEIRRGSSRSP